MKTITVNNLKECLGIGVDVSKDSLSVAGLTENKSYFCDIKNTLKDIEVIVKKLVKANYKGKIICESTGHYHLKLVSVFSKYNLNFYVINPLQSSKHSKANVRKTKSDPVDAETLATMCLTEKKLPKPTSTNDDNILISLKMGQVRFVEKLIQKLTSSINAYEETYKELGFALSENQKELKAILKQVKHLQKRMLVELERLVIKTIKCPDDVDVVKTIPGVSGPTAALWSQLDRDVKSCNSWIAFMGMDTSVKQSGKWKGRGKLTKRGNGYYRKRAFSSAWGAMMNDDNFRAYYDELRARGRTYTEALCIIAKKQIRIAYHLLVNKEKYSPDKAFSG